jgi:hypothetical protein
MNKAKYSTKSYVSNIVQPLLSLMYLGNLVIPPLLNSFMVIFASYILISQPRLTPLCPSNGIGAKSLQFGKTRVKPQSEKKRGFGASYFDTKTPYFYCYLLYKNLLKNLIKCLFNRRS